MDSMKSRNLITFITEEYYSRVSRRISLLTKITWKYTLEVLKQLIDSSTINYDCGIRIDYVMLEQNNRFEILISGEYKDSTKIYVLELLPWENISDTDQLDIVSYSDNEGVEKQCVHPSYQSISYKQYLSKTGANFTIELGVYLFECNKNLHTLKIIDSYKALTKEAPIYFAEDSNLISEKLSSFEKYANGKYILNLFHERDHLSSEGIDAVLSSILSSEEIGMLTEDQKLIMASVIKNCDAQSPTLITVDGAPGTGKTMLAISCMVELGKRSKKVAYVSRTRVQCDMLKNKLKERTDIEFDIEVIPRFRINQKNNFQKYDAIFVDEAQMLTSKMFDDDVSIVIKTIMESADTVICLYSSTQIMYGTDFNQNELRQIANNYNKAFESHNLNRNLRYSGKGSGINWLAHQLQMANTGNYEDWDNDSYEITLVDEPQELFKRVKEKSVAGNPSRVLVRYHRTSELAINPVTGEKCYSLPDYNILIPVCTTLNPNIGSWYKDDSLIDYAAGPYAVQGLEFNYVGVIIGKEISYDVNSGNIVSAKHDEAFTNDEEIKFIKQVYYILLTRGMNGVFIFIEDIKLRNYIKERLQYSSRRFLWIKALAAKYNEETEKSLLQKKATLNSPYYISQMYETANEFIQELKQYSENQLDGESFKTISDKCSAFLLRLQNDPMKQIDIQKKYKDIIVKSMGKSAWEKLSYIGQKCLISSELTYHDMKDYNQLYDFSAVCIQVSKAVEYELTRRFFVLYIPYLEVLYDKTNNPDDFFDNIPHVIKKKERNGIRILKEQEVTLGTIPFIVGLNLDGVITDQSAYDEFEGYASKELLLHSQDVKKTLAKHIKYIVRIKNDYRNKAAHKNPLDVVSARSCLDYVIEVQRTLGQMLDDYKI